MNPFTWLGDQAATARAIEDNAAQLLLTMGRAGGGEEHHDSNIRWTIGGSPIDYHNAVVYTDLTAEQADPAIAAVIAKLVQSHVPGSWHLTASMSPSDLGERLIARGFALGGVEPGMAVDLQALNEDVPAPPNLRIERVQDEATLQVWARTLALGFGEGEREASWVRDVYRLIGLGDDTPFRHYLGWLDDVPAGTASLFMDGSTAGIYFVMTVPQMRRKGIGAAITLSSLREARDVGYQVGVLGSSEMGYSVYRRIGFAEYCRIAIYDWHASRVS